MSRSGWTVFAPLRAVTPYFASILISYFVFSLLRQRDLATSNTRLYPLDHSNQSSLASKNRMTLAQLNWPQAGAPPSLATFRAWLARARPDERFEYHRGFLAIDRIMCPGPRIEAERGKLAAVADHALALAVRGELHLLQERHGDGDYSYWAVARASPPSVVERVPGPSSIAPRSEHPRP
jgi:hypothetical protein